MRHRRGVQVLAAAAAAFVLFASAAEPGPAIEPSVRATGAASQTHYTPLPKSFLHKVDSNCPADKPLNCHNGACCPAGYTLYCTALADDGGRACLNPDTLTPEQLALARENCNPLLACTP
jgi:hypothetical protein